MSFDRPCNNCKKATRPDGEPLEVCYSDRHSEYRCGACHFRPTAGEIHASENPAPRHADRPAARPAQHHLETT